MPKTDRNREIDKIGSILLEQTLLQFCVLNKLQDDFGIDYHADILNNHVLQGEAFYIQLKSHENISIQKDGSISESIDWDHLEDWRRRPLPLYLCSVDTAAAKIYWIWIQDYLKSISWNKKQKKHSVRIPVTNEICNNLPLFMSSVHNAIATSRSFVFAEKYVVKKMEERYPFFKFSSDYINGQERRKIVDATPYKTQFFFDEKKRTFCLNHIPASPFRVGFSFPSDLQQRNFFRGEPGECKVTETSCPDLFCPEGKYFAKLTSIRHDTDASLIIRDSDGFELYRMDGFTGAYSHFQNHYGFKFTHPTKIISFDMFDDKTTCEFRYTFWDECLVTQTPYLDIMSAFFRKQELGYSVELAIHCDDQYIPVTFGGFPQTFDFIKNRVHYLSIARKVFHELKIDLKVNEFFRDIESSQNQNEILCILGSLWEKTWKKKVRTLLDLAIYFRTERVVKALEDCSLHTTISEEMNFFKWKIKITTSVTFTKLEPMPDNKGFFLNPTSTSEIIHEIKDVQVL